MERENVSMFRSSEQGELVQAYPNVYVAYPEGDKISYISHGDKLTDIGVEMDPVAMMKVTNANGEFIYNGHLDGQVSIINQLDNTLIDNSIQLPGKMVFDDNYNILVSHDGKTIYLANHNDDEKKGYVTVIDTLTHKLITSIEVGSKPEAMVLTYDGYPNANKLYVMNTGSHSASVINTISHKVIATISLTKDQPKQLAITRDNKHFVIGYFNSNKIHVGDVETDRIMFTRKANEHCHCRTIGVSLDNKYVYVGRKSNRYDALHFTVYSSEDFSTIYADYLGYNSAQHGSTVKILEIEDEDNKQTILLGGSSENSRLFKVARDGDQFSYEAAIKIGGFSGYFDITADHHYVVTANPHEYTLSYINNETNDIAKRIKLSAKARLVIIV